jgi:hypothetical protein
MFDFRTERLCRAAIAHVKANQPIPLDLFAKLFEAGVDVDELERINHRKGKQ